MFRITRFFSALMLLCFFSGNVFSNTSMKITQTNENTLQQGKDFQSDRIVVKFKTGIVAGEKISITGINSIDKILMSFYITELEQVLPQRKMRKVTNEARELESVYFIRINGKKIDIPSLIQNLKADENVIYAEPLYIHKLDVIPNDSFYSSQSTFFQKLQAPAAWDVVKGENSNAVIAVVDGGTDYDHTDLAGNFWVNTDEVAGNGVDDDGNGFIDDINGWNFTTNSYNTTGLSSQSINANHGTHTAGSISAVTNNSSGVAGASWNAALMPVCAASPTTDNAILYGFDGILYAANNGADIISCSWGGSNSSYYEQDVVNYVTSLGAVVVAAAGNDYSSAPHYPSAYDNVFSVAAVNNSDVKASFSNYGTTVDVAAPGVNIYSTYNNNSYNYSSGTSMSCPLAAGIVGLVKTQHPNWSGYRAAEQVRVTADNIDNVNPSYAGMLGMGRINAYRALTETPPSLHIVDVDLTDTNGDGVIDPGETIQLHLTIKNYLFATTNVDLTLSESDSYVTLTTNTTQVASIDSMQEVIVSDFSFDVNSSAPSGHPMDFTLEFSAGTYVDKDKFRLIVLPTFGTASINNISVSVTNIGRIGFADPNNSANGIGFLYQNSGNLLFEGSIITGTSQTQLSNAARSTVSGSTVNYNSDFSVAAGGDLQINTPGSLTDQESIGIFEDVNNTNPMNIRITQETYASTDPAYSDLILFKYTVENLNTTAINNFHFGLFFDWDIDGNNYVTNSTTFDATRNLAYTWDTGSGPATYVGASLVTAGGFNFRAIANDGSNGGWSIYDGFSDAEKWESISGGTTLTSAGPQDVSQVIASGPHSIDGNSSVEICFALLAGPDLSSIQSTADSAVAMWNNLFVNGINDNKDRILPATFSLEQNTPNPFNPNTKINFTLPEQTNIKIEVFDILGKRIRTLTNQSWDAGNHQIEWDGTNAAGELVAGNVYLYRLSTKDFVQTRKMILLK